MKKYILPFIFLFTIDSLWGQCCSNGINLLANYNPDFSAAFIDTPPGFITDNPYTFFPTPGTYIIVPYRDYGACFSTPQADHTTNDPINGRFLWFDTSPTASPTDPDVAWQPFDPSLPVGSESFITVAPNTTYVFSCWIRDLARNPDCITGGSPLMGLRINGQELAEVDLALITDPCCPQWTYLCSDWNSGDNTTALIQIESRRNDGYNDLGIDDVYFGTTAPFDFSLGSDTSVCLGVSIVLSDTTTNSTSLWSNASTGDEIQVIEPGVYWLEVTKNNCVARDSIVVTQLLPPSVYLGADSIVCNQSPLLLTPINSGGNISSYLWQNNSISNNLSITNSGLYWLQANNNCGNSTDSINVIYFTPPSLGKDTNACNGNEFLINGGDADSYLWSTGETTPSISTSESGIYWVETNTDQCFGRDSIEIIFLTIPLTDLGKDSSFCDQDFITLSAFGASTYLWSDGSTSASINISNSGNYWVEASNGGCFSRDSAVFEFNSTPFLELGNDTTICQGENIELTPGFASNYLWSDGSSNAFLDISESGLYWLQLSNGECLIRDSITISTKLCDVVIALPNSFTPNADGFNDKFIPKEFQGIDNATLKILNRWGSEIFITNDLQQGWDGNYNNNSCADGTYFWTVEYSSFDGEKKGIAGFVTLIR